MKHGTWWVAMTALAITLALGGAGTASACPSCKEAVAESAEGGSSVSAGYNYSILVMLAVPFTMLGAGMFAVVRAARRGELPQL